MILKGANSLIKNNQMREPKELYTEIKGNISSVTVHDAYYYEDEVRYVVNEIAHLINKENYIEVFTNIPLNFLYLHFYQPSD